MNLVGNSCISSYIVRDIIGQKFTNPFVWCIMDFDSCYNLVKYWDELNFWNYDIIKDNDWNFSILIDNKVKVQFVHYIFSKADTVIRKKDNNVYYNHIWEYIDEKYKKRIANIKSEKPIFIFATANYGFERHKPFTLEQQKKLEALNSQYKIIFSFKDMIKSDNIICITQDKKFFGNDIVIAKYIWEKINEHNYE